MQFSYGKKLVIWFQIWQRVVIIKNHRMEKMLIILFSYYFLVYEKNFPSINLYDRFFSSTRLVKLGKFCNIIVIRVTKKD